MSGKENEAVVQEETENKLERKIASTGKLSTSSNDYNDPVVTTLFYQFQGWINGSHEITTSSIITLISKLIPAIQKIVVGKDRGKYKKQVLIQVLNLLVDEASYIPAENKDLIFNIIELTVPLMVDTMISIAHGDLKLLGENKSPEQIKTCCKIS